jgi:hypothetical protein
MQTVVFALLAVSLLLLALEVWRPAKLPSAEAIERYLAFAQAPYSRPPIDAVSEPQVSLPEDVAAKLQEWNQRFDMVIE